MARRLSWERLDGLAEAHVGGVIATVRKDDTVTPPYVWVVTGCADDRYTAMEGAEKAALAAVATGRSAPEWVAAISRLANSGEAYLTINGIRDTHTLPTLCKLALDGAAGPQTVVIEKRSASARRSKA